MTTASKPRRGRPPRTAKPSEERLVARVSPVELRAAEKAADFSKESLSEFVRNAVAQRVIRVQRDMYDASHNPGCTYLLGSSDLCSCGADPKRRHPSRSKK